MASRILGMGDVLSLIEKAQDAYTREEVETARQKMTGGGLTLEDFRDQISQVKKMGSMDQILGMLPGGDRLKAAVGANELPEKEIGRVVAMIDSMTRKERRDHTLINGSRKKRIAKGSGTSVQEVNRLLKQYLMAKKMAKAMGSVGGRRQLAQLLRSM